MSLFILSIFSIFNQTSNIFFETPCMWQMYFSTFNVKYTVLKAPWEKIVCSLCKLILSRENLPQLFSFNICHIVYRKQASLIHSYISFIGEESVAGGANCEMTDKPTWIVDPLDGTTNFVHRYEDFALDTG